MPIVTFNPGDERIVKLGRHTYVNGMPAFCWSNSGLRFIFRGNSITVSFLPFEKSYTHYMLVKLDRMVQRFPISTGNEKIIIEGLENKRHDFEILKITEGEGIDERVVISSLDIGGVTPELFAPKEKPGALKLEFVGDSLTAGYGNLGPSTETKFYTYQQDSTRAYAYVCAQLLDAEAHYICFSGKGVYANCHGVKDYEIPTFFTHASRVSREPWDFSKWTPDAVIVNAGTNDFAGGVKGEDFEEAAYQFLKQIRATYPNAFIFWAYGMTQDVAFPYIEQAFKRFGDKRSRFIKLQSMYDFKDEVGANGHPNVKSARRQAKVVAKIIKQELKA